MATLSNGLADVLTNVRAAVDTDNLDELWRATDRLYDAIDAYLDGDAKAHETVAWCHQGWQSAQVSHDAWNTRLLEVAGRAPDNYRPLIEAFVAEPYRSQLARRDDAASEALADVYASIKSGEISDARKALRTLGRTGDAQSLRLIGWCINVLEKYPHDEAVRQLTRLHDDAKTSPEHRLLIKACTPDQDNGAYRHAQSAAAAAAGPHHRDDGLRPPLKSTLYSSKVRRSVDSNRRQEQRSPDQQRAEANFADYVEFQAGVADGPQLKERDERTKAGQPYASNIDFDNAAGPAARGLPCVCCWSERATSDAATDRVRVGHGDDGLCGGCRESGEEGIPELPVGHSVRDAVEARCATIVGRAGGGALEMLRKDWLVSAPQRQELIQESVARHLPQIVPARCKTIVRRAEAGAARGGQGSTPRDALYEEWQRAAPGSQHRALIEAWVQDNRPDWLRAAAPARQDPAVAGGGDEAVAAGASSRQAPAASDRQQEMTTTVDRAAAVPHVPLGDRIAPEAVTRDNPLVVRLVAGGASGVNAELRLERAQLALARFDDQEAAAEGVGAYLSESGRDLVVVDPVKAIATLDDAIAAQSRGLTDTAGDPEHSLESLARDRRIFRDRIMDSAVRRTDRFRARRQGLTRLDQLLPTWQMSRDDERVGLQEDLGQQGVLREEGRVNTEALALQSASALSRG